MSKFILKTVKLSLVFTESQHLAEFSPIMKISFQRTKRGDFHIHYFTGGLTYVAISRHFIHKSIIWRLCSGKTIILRISLIHVLSYLLIHCIHLHHSWEVLRFKFEKKPQKLFTDNLTSFNLKIVFKSPVRVKSFFLLRQLIN